MNDPSNTAKRPAYKCGTCRDTGTVFYIPGPDGDVSHDICDCQLVQEAPCPR